MSDKQKFRLADLAREAKVSAATVSRFLSGSATVNPRTSDRITQAANRIGFNLVARKSSRVIVFLLSNRNVQHPFHSAVLTGAEHYCAEHGYGLLFMSLQYST